jgi:hypothetical protein
MYKFISILFFTICSCHQEIEDSKIKQEILGQNKMVYILKDIRLADSNAKLLKINRDSTNLILEQHYDKVFQIHKVDKKTFLDSYSYYLEHPKELNLIYEKVLEELLKLDLEYKN